MICVYLDFNIIYNISFMSNLHLDFNLIYNISFMSNLIIMLIKQNNIVTRCLTLNTYILRCENIYLNIFFIFNI